jgi:Skp family chaperone for outer membrane proteins
MGTSPYCRRGCIEHDKNLHWSKTIPKSPIYHGNRDASNEESATIFYQRRFKEKEGKSLRRSEHMRKFSHLILSGFLLVGFVSVGFTQETFNVGVIYSAKVMQTSAEGKKAMFTLKQKEQQINDELTNIDNQAKELELKLSSQKLVLSLESQQQMAYDLEQLRTKRKRAEEDHTKEYQQLEFSLVTKIRNEVFPIIESVAKEKNFRLVFDLSVTGVAYVDPVIDITDEVIQRYDEVKSSAK